MQGLRQPLARGSNPLDTRLRAAAADSKRRQRLQQLLICSHKGRGVQPYQLSGRLQQPLLHLVRIPAGGAAPGCRGSRRLGPPEARLQQGEHLLLRQLRSRQAELQQGEDLAPRRRRQRQQQPGAGCPLGHLGRVQQASRAAVPRQPQAKPPLLRQRIASGLAPLIQALRLLPCQAWPGRPPCRRRWCRRCGVRGRGGGVQEAQQLLRQLPAALLRLAGALPATGPAQQRRHAPRQPLRPHCSKPLAEHPYRWAMALFATMLPATRAGHALLRTRACSSRLLPQPRPHLVRFRQMTRRNHSARGMGGASSASSSNMRLVRGKPWGTWPASPPAPQPSRRSGGAPGDANCCRAQASATSRVAAPRLGCCGKRGAAGAASPAAATLPAPSGVSKSTSALRLAARWREGPCSC